MDNRAVYLQEETEHEAQKIPLELVSNLMRRGYYSVIGLVHSAPISTEVKEIILLHLYTSSGPVWLV